VQPRIRKQNWHGILRGYICIPIHEIEDRGFARQNRMCNIKYKICKSYYNIKGGWGWVFLGGVTEFRKYLMTSSANTKGQLLSRKELTKLTITSNLNSKNIHTHTHTNPLRHNDVGNSGLGVEQA
jgi:hypothetical protein